MSPYSSGHMSSGQERRRRRWVVPLVIILVVVAVLAAAGVACALSLRSTAERVSDEAQSLSSAASRAEAAVESLDGPEMLASASELQEGIGRLEDELDGTLVSLACRVPRVGTAVEEARSVMSIAKGLASDVLAPVGQTLSSYPLDSLMSSGSGVDGDAVRSYCALVSQVEPAIDSAREQLGSLGTLEVSQLNDIVDRLKGPLDQAGEAIDEYGGLIERLPGLLGCDRARTYLVVAQNNAEIRATGGYPGAWGTVTLDNGQAALGEFTTIVGGRSVEFELTDDELAVFGVGMSQSPGNLNETPDFPRAAQLFSQAWAAYMGQAVDGVVAMDPRFLQDMLGLVGGSVTASDGTVIDGTNAAWQLLNQTYWRYGDDGTAQDEFFAEVAGLVADQVMESLGSADLEQLLDVVQADAEKGRILAWSADATEESALAQAGLAGALPSDPAEPVVGVYLNDETWAKMCWYLLMDTQALASSDNADGTVTYQMRTTLVNTITPEEAASAPRYITGSSPAKRSVDDICVKPLLVAPAGGTISGVQCSSGAAFAEAQLYGHDAWTSVVNVGAQETLVIDYQVTVAAGAAPLAVHQTPTGQGA